MVQSRWAMWGTVAVSSVAAVAEFVIGSLDRDGNFRGSYDGPLPLLLSPYLLMAVAGWWNRSRSRLGLVCVLTAVVVATVGLGVHWSDYLNWRSTPPNQQGQSWARFLAFLAQLALCLALYVSIGVVRLLLARQSAKSSIKV